MDRISLLGGSLPLRRRLLGALDMLGRRKTHRFLATLFLHELANVPRLSGILFCKVRLLEGSYAQESPRQEVLLNVVHWGVTFEFEARVSVNPHTGVLDSCVCRLSVRKDVKGGKSFEKVGYADLDLSEFAGSGLVTRHCLLEGYGRKASKPDNSILKVRVRMRLLAGDPCFRVPASCVGHSALSLSTLPSSASPEHSSYAPGGRARPSTPPSSPASPFSLPRLGSCSIPPCRGRPAHVCPVLFPRSAFSLDTLQRQREVTGVPPGTSRWLEPEQAERAAVAGQLTRVGHTRVDARDVVEHLCRERLSAEADLQSGAEDEGLTLYVGSDGTATVGHRHARHRDASAAGLEKVVF